MTSNRLPAVGFKSVRVELSVAWGNVGHHQITPCHSVITARVAENVYNNMTPEYQPLPGEIDRGPLLIIFPEIKLLRFMRCIY